MKTGWMGDDLEKTPYCLCGCFCPGLKRITRNGPKNGTQMASKPQAIYSARDRNRFLMKYSASKAMPDWLRINRALIVSGEIGILAVYQQHSIRD
jgi:hypothetical protein